jgi:hypothetical protein
LAFSYWTIKPWFLTEGNLLLYSSYLPLGVSNWTVIYINTVPQQAPTDLALPPINSLHRENPKARASIHEKYCKPPPSLTLVWEGPEALPGSLQERGIITGGLLHRHAYPRSDA